MTASLSDILTTQKNGVVAINGLNQTLKGIQVAIEQVAINTALATPSLMSPTVPAGNAGTQIVVGAGRLFAVSIPTHSGGSQIRVYNSATTGGISATNLIFQSLPSNTTGWQTYYTVNLAYTNGLVVATDASTTCAVSYTPNP
jgi:hypothetical protein